MAKELNQPERQALIQVNAARAAQDIALSLSEHNVKLQRRINRLKNSGLGDRQIFATLDADFRTVSPRGKRGGPIFRSMFKDVETSIQDVTKSVNSTAYHHRAGIINLTADEVGNLTTEVSGELMIWICALGSAGKGGPTCQDCLIRNGQERTFAEWTSLGLPASGFSRCDDNCNCRLVPKGRVGRPVDTKKPLRLASRKVRVKVGDIARIANKAKNTPEEKAILRALGSAKNKKENKRIVAAFKERF